MIIDLKNPPSFLTLHHETLTLTEGVEVTGRVRCATHLNNGVQLPADLKRLVVGRPLCGCADWIEVELNPPSSLATQTLVWTGDSIAPDTPGWRAVRFLPTAADSLTFLYGPQPADWVAEQSCGIPQMLTATLSLIVHPLDGEKIFLDVVETATMEGLFREAARSTALRFLEARRAAIPG